MSHQGAGQAAPPNPNFSVPWVFPLDYDTINFYNLLSQTLLLAERKARTQQTFPILAIFFIPLDNKPDMQRSGRPASQTAKHTNCLLMNETNYWGGSPFLDCAPHGKRGAGSLRATGSGIILGADFNCRFLTVIRNRDFSGCISGLYITHPLLDSSMFSESWDTVLGS